jgi:hypothetical protein
MEEDRLQNTLESLQEWFDGKTPPTEYEFENMMSILLNTYHENRVLCGINRTILDNDKSLKVHCLSLLDVLKEGLGCTVSDLDLIRLRRYVNAANDRIKKLSPV